MRTNLGKRHVAWLTAAIVLALALAPAGRARAEDAGGEGGRSPPAAERLAALEASVAEHVRAKDAAGLIADVGQVVALHAEAAGDDDVRVDAVRLLGSLTRSRRVCPTVTVAALEGLGRTGDPEGARYVTSHLRRLPRDGQATEPLRAAVTAAALLCQDEFVGPLLRVVTDSKNYALAAQAAQALGNFRHCERQRERILKELVESAAKDRPGVKGRSKDPVEGDQYRNTGELARNRWAALSRVLPAALANLTGREVTGATTDWWIEQVRENKHDLGLLFVDDE